MEDEEEKKEAVKQLRIRKTEREACLKKAAEEADLRGARLQGVLDKAKGNLIQGIMAGKGRSSLAHT